MKNKADNVTGVLERQNIRNAISLITKVVPDVKNYSVKSDVLFTYVYHTVKDSSGTPMDPHAPMMWTSENVNVPDIP